MCANHSCFVEAGRIKSEIFADPNEEKVLGSILLPSYTISPLSKDDGVYRKYAFKAEHAGMRTYFFAAETKDSMLQWMNNMSLASILQNENKYDSDTALLMTYA